MKKNLEILVRVDRYHEGAGMVLETDLVGVPEGVEDLGARQLEVLVRDQIRAGLLERGFAFGGASVHRPAERGPARRLAEEEADVAVADMRAAPECRREP